MKHIADQFNLPGLPIGCWFLEQPELFPFRWPVGRGRRRTVIRVRWFSSGSACGPEVRKARTNNKQKDRNIWSGNSK